MISRMVPSTDDPPKRLPPRALTRARAIDVPVGQIDRTGLGWDHWLGPKAGSVRRSIHKEQRSEVSAAGWPLDSL